MIKFEYTLLDGRRLHVEADDFSSDMSVGLGMSPEVMKITDAETGLEVDPPDAEIDAIVDQACEMASVEIFKQRFKVED